MAPTLERSSGALTIQINADSTLITLWHRGLGAGGVRRADTGDRNCGDSGVPYHSAGGAVELSGDTVAVSVDVAGPSARTFRVS